MTYRKSADPRPVDGHGARQALSCAMPPLLTAPSGVPGWVWGACPACPARILLRLSTAREVAR